MSKAYTECSDIKTNLGEHEFSLHVLTKEELVVIHDALKIAMTANSKEDGIIVTSLNYEKICVGLIKAIEYSYFVPHKVKELIPLADQVFPIKKK